MRSTAPVPAGYVVTHVEWNHPTCSGFLFFHITNDLYPEMGICSVTPVPPGYVTTYSSATWPSCRGYYFYMIRRL